ncbi:sensor histidine kinase [Paenibacillus sp. 1P07SE]|uniref:sensor histidine kinase n=1 Tax=Paenibacillus sp. 1P07SE TaxID=3132209 RepID=UPI0039A46717
MGSASSAERRHISFLRRFSIKQRLVTALIVTSILPVILVAYYANHFYEASISDKLSAFSLQILSESAINASRELEQYEVLSESIIINRSIQTGLRRADSMSYYEKNALTETINNELGEHAFRLSNLSNIIVLTREGEPFYDLGYEWYKDNRISQSLQGLEESAGNLKWSYLLSNRGANKIALSRVIYSEDNLSERIGYLIIVIDEKVFLRNTYDHVSLGDGGRIYITDKQGLVISSASPDIRHGVTYKQEGIFRQLLPGETGQSFYTRIDGERVLVSGIYIRTAGWYMIGLIPHSYIISEMAEVRGNLPYIWVMVVIVSAGAAMWIYRSISTPMIELLQYASRVKTGNADRPLSVRYPDEMGKLTDTIDQMVRRLKQLIGQVEQEQQGKREAELKMLQAQINPHFLFNTLGSLKWSAMMSGNVPVEKGIESLSELLRQTILDQEELIPLEKEIGNLFHYAVIQQIRYGDSFKLLCEFQSDELHECLVPRFILQPIVENSILHGGSEDGSRVTITVEVTAAEDVLQIRIADDGRGFDVKEAEEKKHSHEKLSGIGIGNVRERIRLYVGYPYGMVTRSEPGRGTETLIRLPVKREEEDIDVQDRHCG